METLKENTYQSLLKIHPEGPEAFGNTDVHYIVDFGTSTRRYHSGNVSGALH